MPELAEVEYFRRQWDAGLGQRIDAVEVHAQKRIFRGTEAKRLVLALTGATLERSEARGKQMLFVAKERGAKTRAWLGLHLGMTGRLRVEEPDFSPAKHDHLVLRQAKRALVFEDARLFGRVLFAEGVDAPAWWGEAAARFACARVHGAGSGDIPEASRQGADQGGAADAGALPRHRQLDGG